MNLQERVLELIKSDDGYVDAFDRIIKRKYDRLSEEEKEKLDDIFISLCGFGLNTIIDNPVELGVD
jgi:hypothetical protein